MSREPQEPDDLKSYYMASTYVPQRLSPQSGDKGEGTGIGIGIGAVYVWAVFGLAFASGPALFWAVFGVAYSLGLAWLAKRYPPKHLAWGTLGLNPAWGILLFLAITDLPDMVGVVILFLVVMFFWVGGCLLTLGLWKDSMWYYFLHETKSYPSTTDIVLGMFYCTVGSFFGGIALFLIPTFGRLFDSLWPVPIAGLSLVGLAWTVSQSRGRRVRINWSQDIHTRETLWEQLGGWGGLIALAITLLALVFLK